MMDNQDLKNKLNESLSNYEIKTTSNDILNAYYDSQEVSEKKHHFGFFKFALPTLVLASTIVGLVLIPSVRTSTDPELPKLNSKKNQTAFQIFSGMNIIDNLNSTSNIQALKMKKALYNSKFDIDEDDEDEFEEEDIVVVSFDKVVDAFNPTVDVISSLLETSINVESTLSEGEFIGVYGTYPYKLEVYDYVLYTNITLEEEDDEDETTKLYQGEILTSEGLTYKVEMNIEEEMDEKEKEQEIEMKIIYTETSYLRIEQETEVDERSYKYTLFENDQKTYQEKISFEDEQEKHDSIDVEVLKDGIIYNFEKVVKDETSLKAEYFVNKDDDYLNSFEMKEENNIRTYINNLNEKIEIKL